MGVERVGRQAWDHEYQSLECGDQHFGSESAADPEQAALREALDLELCGSVEDDLNAQTQQVNADLVLDDHDFPRVVRVPVVFDNLLGFRDSDKVGNQPGCRI